MVREWGSGSSVLAGVLVVFVVPIIMPEPAEHHAKAREVNWKTLSVACAVWPVLSGKAQFTAQL